MRTSMKKMFTSAVCILILSAVLVSCGKDKIPLPEGYPTAFFPVCESVGIVYSDVSGVDAYPIYSVNYESKLNPEDVFASYMLTIPDSDVFDTENGYMLAGKADNYRYTIYIEEIEKAENKGAKSLIKTTISKVS